MKNYSFRYSFTAFLLALFCVFCAKTHAQQTSPTVQVALTSSPDAAIPAAQLLQPAELMQILRSSNGEQPLILQVGSRVFYNVGEPAGGCQSIKSHLRPWARPRRNDWHGQLDIGRNSCLVRSLLCRQTRPDPIRLQSIGLEA
jgi:hypothetical protein